MRDRPFEAKTILLSILCIVCIVVFVVFYPTPTSRRKTNIMITLFVVDMQRGFGAYKECLQDVIREIKLAKRRNDPIVFVELSPRCNGNTRPKLIEEAERGGYKKMTVTTKHDGDGSKELVAAAKAAGFQTNKVRVCGVNRNACVSNTILGLMRMKDDVHTIEVGFAATAPGPKTLGSGTAHYGNQDYHYLIKRGLILKR